MACEKYRIAASAFIDRQLRGNELVDYLSHSVDCSDCLRWLREIRAISAVLSRAEQVNPPPALHRNIIQAVRSKERRLAWLPPDLSSARISSLLSYSIGATVSVLLFTATLAGLRPNRTVIQQPLHFAAAAVVPSIRVTSAEDQIYDDPYSPAYTDDLTACTLPKITATSSLVSFGILAYRNSGSEGLAALVVVSAEGQARVSRILRQPNDPQVIAYLDWSLSKRPFLPARISGRPVPTRIVLMLEKVDIRA